MKDGKQPAMPSAILLFALCSAIAILLAACGPSRFVPDLNNPFSTSEQEALVDLYNATGGADWRNNSGWLTDQHIETWHGVRYSRASYQRANDPMTGGAQPDRVVEMVQGLALGANRLSGEIPGDWGGLKNLRSLSLRENQLSGEIPSDLGKLDHLLSLDLSGNQLSGEIPSKLGSLSRLRGLYLTKNQLSGEIPSELGGLRDLESLYLQGNNLSGEIPPELGGLSKLWKVYLGGNQFTGCMPASWKRVQDNDFLRLGLRFCDDQSQGALIPVGSDTEALAALYNAAGGESWRDNTNWMSSEPLHKWYGLSSRGSRSGRIHTLYLKGNNLKGELPPELASLRGLLYLDLTDNDLSGDIPSELGSLRGLYMMYLGGNQFTGCIPASWKSTSRNDFDRLGLPFCARIHDRSDTETLAAIYNALGGEEWKNNTNWLSDEPVDDWYGVRVDADGRGDALILEDNRLSGEIPPELGNLVNLKALNLRRNQLSGEIPPELANLVNLKGLNLRRNQLSGKIPSELGNLVNLKALHLHSNRLSGEIPPELGNLVNLKYLYLSGNQLSGEIPPELGNLVNLKYLYLSGNQLSGEIPPELGNLVKLDWRGMRLSGNPLTGCLPRNLQEKMSDSEFRDLGLPLCDNTGAIPGRVAPVAFYNATDGISGRTIPKLLNQLRFGFEPANALGSLRD